MCDFDDEFDDFDDDLGDAGDAGDDDFFEDDCLDSSGF